MADRQNDNGDGAGLSRLDRFLDRLIEFLTTLGGAAEAPDAERETTFTRLDRVLDGLLYAMSSLLLIAITAAVLYSVFTRYVLNYPPLWSEEAPIVLFIWMTFIALAVATRRDVNIKVTFFIEKFAPRGRLILEMVMHALVLIMIGVVIWYAFPIISFQLRGTMLSTGWSNAVSWFPLPIGMALIGVYQVVQLRRSWRTYRRALQDQIDARGG